MEPKSKRIPVIAPTGWRGIYDRALKKFTILITMISFVFVYSFAILSIGLALAPALAWLDWSSQTIALSQWPTFVSLVVKGMSFGIAWFIWGFALIFTVPLVNFLIRATPKPFRGPYFGYNSVRWVTHNSLTYLMRYTFLEWITPTPFNILFFRLMGMKVGRGTVINSSNISDPGLIQLGKNVTIGGSASITAHYGADGFLVIAPVIIHDRATIGLKATIMGATEVGEGALVLAHSFVLPKTKIPAGETWGGIPAKKIES